jgi:threonine dehydratase
MGRGSPILRKHCEGAATIGLELVDTVPSFYALLIALGGGALATGVGHPERGQQAPEQHAMGDRSGTRPTRRRSARVAVE